MKTLLRLFKLILPLFPIMILAVLFGTVGHLCAIGIPVLGAVALQGTIHEVNITLWILPVIGIARGICHYIEQYNNHYLAFAILARIREIVFKKLRELGPAKLETKEKGNLISLLTSDIELLEVFYAHTISPVCIAVLVSTAMLIFFAQIHISLMLVALGFYVLVGIVVPLAVNKSAVKLGTIHREEFAEMNVFLLDCLRELEQSILFSNGSLKLKQIQEGSDRLSATRKKLAVHEGFTAAISALCVSAGGLTMLGVSLWLYHRGQTPISIEQVIVAVTAMFSSFGPVFNVAALGSGLSGTIASGNRVLALLDEEPVLEDVTEGTDPSFNGAASESVCFSYPSNPSEKVLQNVSIDFPKNKIIGIQGKSGCGKSTLLKLFMHFWKSDSGSVKISGTDVLKINTPALRKIESYVTQETVLFHDTIENNIRIAKQNATPEEIQNACKKAAIHDFIMELPMGYQTQVAELGDNFSGGERQRLGLARAFLHDGEFLLLDEPTSNLDSWNEHQIMKAVKDGSKGKTVVIVSHRDSTFEFADSVILMNKDA